MFISNRELCFCGSRRAHDHGGEEKPARGKEGRAATHSIDASYHMSLNMVIPHTTSCCRHSFSSQDERGFRNHRREIGYGTVTRAIRLPRDAKAEDVKAKFENGILEVDIPKVRQA